MRNLKLRKPIAIFLFLKSALIIANNIVPIVVRNHHIDVCAVFSFILAIDVEAGLFERACEACELSGT
jgi:hypothetical protein